MELHWGTTGPATEAPRPAWREAPPTDASRVSAWLSRAIEELPETLVRTLMVEVFDELCELAVAIEAPAALVRFLCSPTDVHLEQARCACRSRMPGAIDVAEFLGLSALLHLPRFDMHRALDSAIRVTARTRALDLAALMQLGPDGDGPGDLGERFMIELMRFALLVHRRASGVGDPVTEA
ncbi:MAG: hypothetical protein U1F36_05450 [Planctomycetota bacterium]